jgi:hypothetical protein
MCPIVIVALSGLLTCVDGEVMPILSPADVAAQYTIIFEGRQQVFCVAGATLDNATHVRFEHVRAFLNAHAERCAPVACSGPHNLLHGEVAGWWQALQYSLGHPLDGCS